MRHWNNSMYSYNVYYNSPRDKKHGLDSPIGKFENYTGYVFGDFVLGVANNSTYGNLYSLVGVVDDGNVFYIGSGECSSRYGVLTFGNNSGMWLPDLSNDNENLVNFKLNLDKHRVPIKIENDLEKFKQQKSKLESSINN